MLGRNGLAQGNRLFLTRCGERLEAVTGAEDDQAVGHFGKGAEIDLVFGDKNPFNLRVDPGKAPAFDMRLLQLKEARTGVVFSQPILDTLLLSAVLHANQDSHQIERIAERLGTAIEGRHNALGDACATGEIFRKMLPCCPRGGIITLRQALQASEKTISARVQYESGSSLLILA